MYMKHSHDKKTRRKINKDSIAYIALAIIVILGIFTFATSNLKSITGHSIADNINSIKTIAIEDGADADLIVTASNFARTYHIKDTMLLSESTGSEENTLIVQKLGGDSATIKKAGSNIILEGDAKQGFRILIDNDQALSAYDAVEINNGIVTGVSTTEEQKAVCTDSDGGDNPNVYGTLSGTDADGNIISQTDQCGSGTATVNDVFEKVCTDTSYTYIQHQCANGCKDGACITLNNCVDSDGGDNPNVYGTLSGTDADGNIISQTDQCGSGTATVNDVFEKVCTDTSYTYTQHQCANGCKDGACITEVAAAICGNSVVEDNEGCDDGNTIDGDGCTADCIIEVSKGCTETSTGVKGTYSGYYYDYNSNSQQEYKNEYTYDNYCYYDSYSSTYYYTDYYCYESPYDSKWYPTTSWTQCSSGCDDAKGCVDVETVTPSCEDTDNGKDKNVYGETTSINKVGEKKTATDTCYSWYDDQYVVEAYCYTYGTNTYLYTEYMLCDGICTDGACVESAYTATCEDSDATDIYAVEKSSYTLGKVTGTDKTGNNYAKEDTCYDSYGYKYVIEQYCNENNAAVSTYVYCRGGCDNGICLESTIQQSCTDSDATETNAGRDIYTAGSAKGVDYYGTEFTYNDYCYYNSWDNKYYVADYYCAESASYGQYASSYWEECPEGCENGACIGASATVQQTCSRSENAASGVDMYGASYTYYDYCNGASALVMYNCNADGTYTATEKACNCVDAQCHTASMTVAQFISSANPVIVIGASAATEDNIAAIDLAGKYGWSVVTDATISDATTGTYVAIGGPYANKVSESAFGGQTWDYGPGEALFLVKEYATEGKTLVVSGSEAKDTRNAIKLLINNPSNLNDVYVVQHVS